jgi:hypothetical protein
MLCLPSHQIPARIITSLLPSEFDMHNFTQTKVATSLLALACCLAVVGGTGTSAKMNRVSLGMTKKEVISAIGNPDSMSASGDTEFLIYHLASPKELVASQLRQYFVRIKEGKVDAYGEKGDFDSTKNPIVGVNIKK